MRQVFTNDTPIAITPDAPNTVTSPIAVSGVEGQIQRLSVSLTLFHTYTSDLRLRLESLRALALCHVWSQHSGRDRDGVGAGGHVPFR